MDARIRGHVVRGISVLGMDPHLVRVESPMQHVWSEYIGEIISNAHIFAKLVISTEELQAEALDSLVLMWFQRRHCWARWTKAEERVNELYSCWRAKSRKVAAGTAQASSIS